MYISRLPAGPTEIHRPAEIPGLLSKDVIGVLYPSLKTRAGCTWQGCLALSTRSVDPARDLHKACCARVGDDDEVEALRRARERVEAHRTRRRARKRRTSVSNRASRSPPPWLLLPL
jgi:hypothetical protein